VFRFPVLRRLKWFLAPYFGYAALAVALTRFLPDIAKLLPRHASEAVLTGILFGVQRFLELVDCASPDPLHQGRAGRLYQ
jgi:hypothetical protein